MEIQYIENILTVDEYLILVDKMGEDETTREQAELTISNQVLSITAIKDEEQIGIARLLGDKAIFWFITDVWVLPEYQGKGIGRALVERLIDHVRKKAPKGYHALFLMSAKGKEGFYEKLGFTQRPHEWEGAGMEMEIHVE